MRGLQRPGVSGNNANARTAVNEGRADYVPVFLSDIPLLFRSRAMPLDAVFVNATPPDEHGFCSLGVSVDSAWTVTGIKIPSVAAPPQE